MLNSRFKEVESMLDKVIRFFIMLTLVIAGGALFRLATPWMATLIKFSS